MQSIDDASRMPAKRVTQTAHRRVGFSELLTYETISQLSTAIFAAICLLSMYSDTFECLFEQESKKTGDKASKLANKVRFEHNWAVDGTIPMTSICYVCNSAIFFFDGKECTRCERIVRELFVLRCSLPLRFARYLTYLGLASA
jgi:hypothetical protein